MEIAIAVEFIDSIVVAIDALCYCMTVEAGTIAGVSTDYSHLMGHTLDMLLLSTVNCIDHIDVCCCMAISTITIVAYQAICKY